MVAKKVGIIIAIAIMRGQENLPGQCILEDRADLRIENLLGENRVFETLFQLNINNAG